MVPAVGAPEEFARHFEEVQATDFWRYLLGDLSRYVPLDRTMAAADVGCGPGLLTRQLARSCRMAVGVDILPAMARRARCLADGTGRTRFLVGDGVRLPLASEAFDRAFLANLAFYHPDPLPLVLELFRICKPGGAAVMLNPAPTLTPATAVELGRRLALDERSQVALDHWARLTAHNETFDRETAEALFLVAGFTSVCAWGAPADIGLAVTGSRPWPTPSKPR